MIRKSIKPALLLALLFSAVGPLLLFIEQHVAGREALRQALPIALLASFFFAYSFCSLLIFRRLIDRKGKVAPAYYMADKMLRLLLCALLLVVYGIFIRQDLLLFSVNLFVFYLTTMVFTNIYCIREEKKLRNS